MNRRSRLTLALPVVALALAGCGSGRHNQQYSEHSVVTAAGFKDAGLSVVDAFITVPAAPGGTTRVIFSVYADSAQDATTLRSVTADSIAQSPATLATVRGTQVTTLQTVPVDYQTGPGSTEVQATFSDLTAPVIDGAYYPVTFTFATGLTTTIKVPVAQDGAVNPESSTPPTTLPEQPYVINTNPPVPLPGS